MAKLLTVTKKLEDFNSSVIYSPAYGWNITAKSSDFPKYTKMVKAEVTLTCWASIRYPEGVWYIIVGNAGRTDFINIADDTTGTLHRYKSPSTDIRGSSGKQTRTFSLSTRSDGIPCFNFDESYTCMLVSFRCTARECHASNISYTLTCQAPRINLVVNSNTSEGGTVTGSCTYDIETKGGSKITTISASPSKGYAFRKWIRNDGAEFSSSSSMDVTLSESLLTSNETTVTYTAVFEPVPVTSLNLSHSELNIKMSDKIELVHDYISTLNLKGLGCGTPNCVSEIKPNYLMLRSTANDAYVGSYGMSSPISDTAKMYVFDIDPNSEYTYIVNAKVPEGGQYSIFVFYYDSNYNYIYHDAQTNKTSNQTIINNSNPWSKQIPANAKYASIRLDNDIAGYEIYYTNVLVYKGNLNSIYNSAAIAEIIKPDDALNKAVMWSSSNSDVVTINEDTGILTAKSVGTAIITCQSRNNKAFTSTCTVNIISEGITSIYLGDVPITSMYLGNLLLTPCLGSLLLQ